MLWNRKKKKAPTLEELGLTPESDEYLRGALDHYNSVVDTLRTQWSFDSVESWNLDQGNGLFFIALPDKTAVLAEGQILGSHSATSKNWEWAWNNPYVDDHMQRDAKVARAEGKRLGLLYFEAPMVPCPTPEFATYLAAVALKASGAQGIFAGSFGDLTIYIALHNLRRGDIPDTDDH